MSGEVTERELIEAGKILPPHKGKKSRWFYEHA
jgi:hypothetical protein